MGQLTLSSFDVVIVSAFSRGVNLAHELSARHKKVLFIDISKKLSCLPADKVGPFGYFGDSQEETTPFAVQSSKESFYFKDFFLSFVYNKRPSFSSLIKGFQKDFQSDWIHHLLQQMFLGVKTPINPQKELNSSYIFKDFSLIQSITPAKQLLEGDIEFSDSADWKWENNTLIGEKEVNSDHFIFLLNPQEFSKWSSIKQPSPSWSWQRFLFQFEDDGYSLPSYLVLADPHEFPWTHERLLCLKRVSQNRFNVWGLFPFHYSKEQFKECEQRVCAQLNQRLPQFKWKCYQKSFVTPSFLFPVYSKEDGLDSNIFWHPNDISANGWMAQEEKILEQIQ